ncbi:MAG: DEAD/DEAH box helicase family protein, partial [Candidatus Sericytochromatia bacterium]|nr:DEAD/DEAH box helicase family protein [Candidatus Sericytochromatia bacterium]
YKKVPFKVALNDGRDVILFCHLQSLKFQNGKDNSFHWVHYLPEKKFIGVREYNNIEYLFDELICQPENMYLYCVNGCSVINSGSNSYLINARIQQYYAIKDVYKTLFNVENKMLPLPYNFEFAHAQRSGKTITMKLISYMIEKSFREVFNTIFIYTPDLQIKKVISDELSKSGNSKINLKVIESRDEYQTVIDNLYILEQSQKESTGLSIYVVNMQKISDKELQINTAKTINSNKILNIIDEAHHGQTKKTALIRDQIFPKASNYLFTATGKNDMYLYYFPDNKKEGFSNKFTISNAKSCKITVPVMFLRAEKTVKVTAKLAPLTEEIEKQWGQKYFEDADTLGLEQDSLDVEKFLDYANVKSSKEIKKIIRLESIGDKVKRITKIMDSVREGLPFFPKAIVYVNSVEESRQYLTYIQSQCTNNEYLGYRFGVDFSSIEKECLQLNPGISTSEQISANFEKDRTKETEKNTTIIDILFAVDKYQKGFDLPSLLVTFLDTNISEPARMNQIFTRTATRFPGKTTGYCVDLTLENFNANTYKQSLLLYDNAEDIGDSFIDNEVLNSLKATLKQQFALLQSSLGLTPENFTSSMILQQVLNEPDLKLRQQRQYSFFSISKNIINNLSKIGSPLFFKPFKLELKALHDAFYEFKTIYADKLHTEHHKILINTDASLAEGYFLTIEEIRGVIDASLFFLKENNIKALIEFEYTNNTTEIVLDSDTKKEVIKKFTQELKKNNIEKDIDEAGDYLSKNHRVLFDMIKDMLARISDDRSIIYQEFTQEILDDIENQLNVVKEDIKNTIKTKFNNNSLLFWANEVANQIFESNGIKQPDFVANLSKKFSLNMDIILPQIDRDLPDFDKVQTVTSMFSDKFAIKSFSPYLWDYNQELKEINTQGISEDFKIQINKAPKSNDGKLFFTREDLFNNFLNQTLRQYYQNLVKV